jgi:hypothetical protein
MQFDLTADGANGSDPSFGKITLMEEVMSIIPNVISRSEAF